MKVTLDISVPSPLWRGLPRARALARETIAAAVAERGAAAGEDAEVSLCLADDARLRALNLRWRGVDKPTNVLSFPMVQEDLLDAIDNSDDGEVLLGDIVLAHGVCTREAAEKGVSVEAHATHLVVHGTFHLLGFDHMTDQDAEEMEAAEREALASLGIDDPYAIDDD